MPVSAPFSVGSHWELSAFPTLEIHTHSSSALLFHVVLWKWDNLWHELSCHQGAFPPPAAGPVPAPCSLSCLFLEGMSCFKFCSPVLLVSSLAADYF